MTEEYTSRLLYEQHCVTEEGVKVLSSIHALSYMYPGALSKTTGRVRLTCIYTDMSSGITVHGGSIEKWRDGGWTLLDEYCDDRETFAEASEMRDRLLTFTKSFLLGLPLDLIDKDYNPAMPPNDPKKANPRKIKSTGRVASTKGKKAQAEGQKESKKPNNYKKGHKKDDPDFDFV